MNKQHMAYKTNEVGTASQVRLVLMMYDGVIRFLNETKKRIAMKDIAGRSLYISKAQKIIGELQDSLNVQQGGEIAQRLSQLYSFVIQNLVKANVTGNPAPIDESLMVLGNLREAWAELVKSSQAKTTAAEQTNNSRCRIAIQL